VRYALELGAGGDAPVPQAPFFTWAAWNPDGFGTVRGRLVLRIGDVDLRLQIFNDPTATEAIKNVFSLHDIEYFVPKKFHERELRLDFAVPVEFEVEYRHWPRWLATVVSLLAVVALLLFLFAGGARVRYLRLVGYSEEPLRLAPGKPQAFAPGGRPVAEFRLTRRGAIVCRPIGDAKVNGSVKQTTVLPGSMVVIVSEGLEYSYRADVVQAPAAAPPRPGAGSGMY
jgi:hypothetical protein